MSKRKRTPKRRTGRTQTTPTRRQRVTTTTASRAHDLVGRPVRDPRRTPDESWSWEQAHEFFRDLAAARGMWAGVPSPVADFAFTLAPGYIDNPEQHAGITEVMDQRARPEDDDEPKEEPDVAVRNAWYSPRLGGTVILYDDPAGVRMLVDRSSRTPGPRAGMLMSTMGASTGWDPEAEWRAMNKLATLIPEHLMTMYRLTGAFMETSARSRVTYILRRCRPTLAVVPQVHGDPACSMRFLASLCLHPVGYYRGTFAGGMVPTDDVIAHLLMIRGDEHFLWRKAYQHAGHEAESGL